MARLSALVGALALLLVRPALAVPNVTAVRINDKTCQKYPYPIPGGVDHVDASGYLQLIIDQADDSAVDGLYSTEIPFEYLAKPPNDENFTVLTALSFDLRKSRSFARVYYRCFDGVLRLGTDFSDSLPQLYNASQLPGFGVYKEQDAGYILETNATIEKAINATADDPWPGYPVDAFAHYDPVTNERLPGVFLGALNSTVWNFAYRTGGIASRDLAYRYDAWLQFDPSGPKDRDTQFQGFIQVIAYN
ncbi:hypothetical protein Sste5346_004095 [Sporothrix stenoceras]|uniref:Uncharacterized protein n=1 Tax=Sporothrix stenoceras TaxID=5173 RepID=A0ABR3ZAL0_9PEZI